MNCETSNSNYFGTNATDSSIAYISTDSTWGGVDVQVSSAVTKKDQRMVKDEIKKYMTTQLKKEARLAAGKVSRDIEKLKTEKIQLGKEITELKTQLEQAKEDIRAEITAMEEMLAKKANEILRFGSLDFSA